MKCSNCGEPIEEGRLFCLHCGTEVQWVPDYDSFGNLMERGRNKKEKKRTGGSGGCQKESCRRGRAAEKEKKEEDDHPDRVWGNSGSGGCICAGYEVSDGSEKL